MCIVITDINTNELLLKLRNDECDINNSSSVKYHFSLIEDEVAERKVLEILHESKLIN